MKRGLIVSLFAIILLAAGLMLGQAVFTEFTGTEAGGGYPDFSATRVNCPGGQQTGLWPPVGQPCTPGSRVHIRGAKFPYIMASTDSRVYGVEEVVMNGNFDGWRTDLMAPGSGQMWGTLTFKVMNGTPQGWTPTGEVWEGSWTGTRKVGENGVQSTIDAVAHGSGGRIEGLQAKWHVILDPTANVGTCQGQILAPPGKTK